MAVWLVRAGKYGEDEALALEKGITVVGWKELPELSGVRSREQMKALQAKHNPKSKGKNVISNASQIWRFVNEIQVGDLVVLPLKTQRAIAIGKVLGGYEYTKQRHTRRVQWLRTDVPRTTFGKDLLYSFGAFMTVCRIERNDADVRVAAVAAGKPDPKVRTPPPRDDEDVVPPEDLTQPATDQIREHIGRTFKGHGLAHLVGAVLTAQGYRVHESPAGPDGGVDILAGRGPMGFDVPRLCVQVKSSDSPVGAEVLNALRGSMASHKADQGLLVAWGGFNANVQKERAKEFFSIRLWDADDLVGMVLDHYDRLTEEIRAELPLKRIWVVVPDGEA